MSHIAAALAKSKGKQVASPSSEGIKGVPSIRIGPPATPLLKTPGVKPLEPRVAADPAVPAASASGPKRGLLIAIVAAILGVVGVSAWLLLKKDITFTRPASAAPATPAPTAPAPAAPVASTPLVSAPVAAAPVPPAPVKAASVKPAPVKAEPVALEPGRKGPSADLQEKVRTLPIKIGRAHV